jgi:hypothetical protein
VLLDRHQDRPTATEDLVGGDLAGPRPAELVEHGEDSGGAAAGLLGEAAELGGGGGAVVEQDGEQGAGGAEGGAVGLGGGGELGLLVGIEGDGVLELGAEFGELGLKLSDFVAEVAEAVVGRGRGLEGLEDVLGLSVEGLP